MAAALTSSADLPLLTPTTGRSYSQRFYTYIHYEYSSHPPRFLVLFFVIIFGSLSFGWLLAGLVRLRQTASHFESCAAGKIQCASGTNLICSLTSSICLCSEQMFWESNQRKCLSVRSISEACIKNQHCDRNKGLICSTNGTCQCPSNTYYTTTGCLTYALVGVSCLTSGAPACNTQLGLVCDTVSQACQCPPSTYWSSARCQPVSTYAAYCDRNTSCNTQAGLFCRLPGSSSACDCPVQSKYFTCDCNQGQAWVTSTTANGTSACTIQGTYAGNCTSSSQCPQGLNLACLAGVCNCNLPLSFWSMSSSKCLPCESLGYILLHYSSQWVCTRLLNASLMTYTASQSACTAFGWSLISPIFASDIQVIAQTYLTYRLWMNMQTSLGSSTYMNNIFPNNQSNWTAYVTSSSVAAYSTYIYAPQLIPSYNSTVFFEGNTNFDTGHALCALY